MSIEAAIEALTKAVEANTAAVLSTEKTVVNVTDKPRGGRKPSTTAAEKKAAAAKAAEAEDEDEDEDEAPAKKTAPKKTTSKKTTSRKKKAPEPTTEIEAPDLRSKAAKYMGSDDEDEREEAKGNVAAALKHLGVKKLPELDDEDRPRLATYLDYWAADLEVNFEAIDELVEAASESGGGDEEEDDDEDMLGD